MCGRRKPPRAVDLAAPRHGVLFALHSGMSVMRIVKVADGEELISFENERVRAAVTDDPREAMLERRLEVSARSARLSVPDLT